MDGAELAGSRTSLDRLADPTPLTLTDALAMWRARDGREPAEFYYLLGERLLFGAGEPLVAYDVVSEALDRWPEHSRLRQLLALSLRRAPEPVRASGSWQCSSRMQWDSAR